MLKQKLHKTILKRKIETQTFFHEKLPELNLAKVGII